MPKSTEPTSENTKPGHRQAAEQGHSNSVYFLANLLEEAGRTREAKDWWQRASERENPE